MNIDVYAVWFTAKIQQGTWHSHDDLEITGYGPHKEQVFYVAATDEIYVKAWWEKNIRYWPKENDVQLLKIERLGSVTVITINS